MNAFCNAWKFYTTSLSFAQGLFYLTNVYKIALMKQTSNNVSKFECY